MGAFDSELASLGICVPPRGNSEVPERQQVSPFPGMLVEFWHPVEGGGYRQAHIQYVSSDLIVIRYAEQRKSKWGKAYHEEALEPRTKFYEILKEKA
jgi:hypothetical protein